MTDARREAPPNSDLPVTRETVEWAYRLVLGRPPESEEAVRAHLSFPNVAALREQFVNSPEFARGYGHRAESIPRPLLEGFSLWRGSAEPDSVRNFLGVRTRCAYLPEPYSGAGGTVEAVPGSQWSALHDVGEWTGLLSAVAEARTRFVIAELGAGWGPWVVAGAVAARQRGIREIRLAAVEADPGHLRFLRQHFADNGLNPDDHLILQAAAGAYDGVARFPRLENPVLEWGAGALFEGRGQADGFTVEAPREWIEVPCVSLATLLQRLPPVDLIHVDIQGSELEVITAALAPLGERVRRLVIGTHGRSIEAGLLEILAKHGWKLEIEKGCVLAQDGNSWKLVGDGLQVWRNPQCCV